MIYNKYKGFNFYSLLNKQSLQEKINLSKQKNVENIFSLLIPIILSSNIGNVNIINKNVFIVKLKNSKLIKQYTKKSHNKLKNKEE